MTRNLRKRHLTLWIVLVIAMIFCVAYARNYMPVFEGDKQTAIR